VRERPWATIVRAPSADGLVWFKACSPVQAFEPRLTAVLATRWPDRTARVLAHDAERAWLLMADAGDPVAASANDPAIWLRALPMYAELQRGEISHAAEHLNEGVPDRRIQTLPALFDDLLGRALPIDSAELERMRRFVPRFRQLCADLAAAHPVASIQHDDLHLRSLFVDGSLLRVLDWGDACLAHPFATLVVTFHWLEVTNGLTPEDPWFGRLRDAYLEPWGQGLQPTLDLALRVGLVAQAIGWQRQRQAMPDGYRPTFDPLFAELLRRLLARVVDRAAT